MMFWLVLDLDGLRWVVSVAGCVLGLLYHVVFLQEDMDIKWWAVITDGYNTQEGGHKWLPHYRPFDVSRPKTRESR